MLDVKALKAEDLKGLSKSAVTPLAAAMLAQLTEQPEHIARRDREIKFKDAKIERITFELARLKAWKFGAKTEAMNAEQRRMSEDTIAEDEADLPAQLQALQGDADQGNKPPADERRKPRRQALPEHLRRVEPRHEPENTMCACGNEMLRIGEAVSERLDMPAEFFVRRHIRGKRVCKCCQQLVQEPVEPQIIDKGVPTAGLLAHTLVGRFVDHLPYFARSRSTRGRACTRRARRSLHGLAPQAQT